MKLKIILDQWDGTTKEVFCNSDNFPSRELIFKMMEGKISGYSVTKYTTILKSIEKMNDINP